MNTHSARSQLTLHNGILMPRIGLGVYDPSFSDEVHGAVKLALELGYRLIDTAAVYRNEDQVGRALRDSGIKRDEVFITSKVWDTDQGYDSTLRAFDVSLDKLDVEYLDLYLVHWPVRATRKDTYKALETLYKNGRVRAIGVSNYLTPHLEELLSYAEILPMVNQFELTPFLYDQQTIELCKEHSITVQSYSPLVRGRKSSHPLLQELAGKHQCTTYQILLRWAIDHGFSTIPKSVTHQRLIENIELDSFSLSIEDLNRLDSLHDGTRVAPDPMKYL